MNIYRIVLADDHQFLLEGILAVLRGQPHLEIAAIAQNGFELMDAVEKHNPHLVILDLNMPGYDGLQSLQKIKACFACTKVLVLTNYCQRELVLEVMKLDADGYLVKNSSATELKAAIETILSGKKHFPSTGDLNTLSEDNYFFDAFLKKYQLTKRESGIIHLICGGLSTKEIAASLFLSELTVTTHRRNILRKLEVKNVAGLINFAKEHLLV